MNDNVKQAVALARLYNEGNANREILKTDVDALFNSLAPYSVAFYKHDISHVIAGDYFVVYNEDRLAFSKVISKESIDRHGKHLYIPLSNMKEFVKTLLRQLIQKSKLLYANEDSLFYLENSVKSLITLTDPVLDETLKNYESFPKEDKETILYQTQERINTDLREALIGSWLLYYPKPFVCPGVV